MSSSTITRDGRESWARGYAGRFDFEDLVEAGVPEDVLQVAVDAREAQLAVRRPAAASASSAARPGRRSRCTRARCSPASPSPRRASRNAWAAGALRGVQPPDDDRPRPPHRNQLPASSDPPVPDVSPDRAAPARVLRNVIRLCRRSVRILVLHGVHQPPDQVQSQAAGLALLRSAGRCRRPAPA